MMAKVNKPGELRRTASQAENGRREIKNESVENGRRDDLVEDKNRRPTVDELANGALEVFPRVPLSSALLQKAGDGVCGAHTAQ